MHLKVSSRAVLAGLVVVGLAGWYAGDAGGSGIEEEERRGEEEEEEEARQKQRTWERAGR